MEREDSPLIPHKRNSSFYIQAQVQVHNTSAENQQGFRFLPKDNAAGPALAVIWLKQGMSNGTIPPLTRPAAQLMIGQLRVQASVTILVNKYLCFIQQKVKLHRPLCLGELESFGQIICELKIAVCWSHCSGKTILRVLPGTREAQKPYISTSFNRAYSFINEDEPSSLLNALPSPLTWVWSLETPLRCEHCIYFLTASMGKSIIHVLKIGECAAMNRETRRPHPHSCTTFCRKSALSLCLPLLIKPKNRGRLGLPEHAE